MIYTILASDAFQRANESPLNPSNWTFGCALANDGCQIVAPGIVEPQSLTGGGVEFYTGVSFPSNQYSTIRLLTCGPSGSIGVVARGSQNGNFYMFAVGLGIGTDAYITILLFIDGITTVLASKTTAVNPGDLMTITAVGGVISGLLNGKTVLSANDTTLVNGSPGIFASATVDIADAQLGSWSGGISAVSTIVPTNDLTTLPGVKNYLGITNTLSDSVLKQLVAAESSNFLFLTRWKSFVPTTVTLQLDGTNTDSLMLLDRPITAVSFVQINGTLTIPQSPGLPQWGYMFDSWGRLTMVGGGPSSLASIYGGWGFGSVFPRGRKNITVTYTYGFPAVPVTNEVQTIPASLLLTPFNGPFYSDQGPTYLTGGNSLTQVSGAPTKAGQYTLLPTGQYLFFAADIGLQISLNYTYLAILPMIAQCVNEMVGFKYGQRGSIGIKQEMITGSASTTRLTDYPDYICRTLRRYERKYGGTANASAGWG